MAGQTATMGVEATGSGTLTYQWFAGPSGNAVSPVTGSVSPSFTTPPLPWTVSYWVRVSNSVGSVDSAAATITVTTPPGTTPPSGASPLEDQVFVLVNQRRASGASCGGTPYPAVPALTHDPQLRDAARGHSQDMASNNYFSHTSLDGRTFSQRIRNAGYAGNSPLGENIAGGYSTAQAVVDGWMQSTGHCQNIMNGGYRAIGIGYAFGQSSTYGHYWTQSFGGS